MSFELRMRWGGNDTIAAATPRCVAALSFMKILVTGPDSADSFGHNVSHVLREMGHEVRTDPTAAFAMKQSVLGRGVDEVLTRLWRRWRMRSEVRVVRMAADFKPQLTLMCTKTFEPESVDEIRRVSGGRVVCWFGDPPANLPREHLVSGEYDALFVKDVDFAGTLRSMLGLEAHHLPEACNPAWHRPLAERDGETIVVAGTGYG